MTSQKFKVREVAWPTGHNSKASFCWRSTQEMPKFNQWSPSSNSTSKFGEPQNESHSWLWIQNTFTGSGMGYWPHFQSVFLLEIYTGDAQIQPMVFILQFNFKIWRAPKWVTFLVVNPKHLQMLSLPKTHWCKYFSDATLESDCFKVASASSADC